MRRFVVCGLAFLASAAPAASSPPPVAFVEQALCVHHGWHYTSRRQPGPPDYVLWHHGYWHTDDVPDSIAGGTGEGSWSATSDPRYGGGLSFTIGTWNRAGPPYAATTAAIADASPAEQIRRAWVVVQGERSPWSEWPTTSRACGF